VFVGRASTTESSAKAGAVMAATGKAPAAILPKAALVTAELCCRRGQEVTVRQHATLLKSGNVSNHCQSCSCSPRNKANINMNDAITRSTKRSLIVQRQDRSHPPPPGVASSGSIAT
jgi:hypothetical protein